MWDCPKCHEAIEDEFRACWNCGTAEDGSEDSTFHTIDPEIADEIRTRPTPEPNPCVASSGDDSNELRDSMIRMCAVVPFLSFASVFAAAITTFFFYHAWNAYATRPDLGPLLNQVSLGEILYLASSAAFSLGFIGTTCFLWRYYMMLRKVINSEKLTLGNIMDVQRSFWKGVVITTIIAILTGFLIFFYVVNFVS